jgi:hypothetical protein
VICGQDKPLSCLFETLASVAAKTPGLRVDSLDLCFDNAGVPATEHEDGP